MLNLYQVTIEVTEVQVQNPFHLKVAYFNFSVLFFSNKVEKENKRRKEWCSNVSSYFNDFPPYFPCVSPFFFFSFHILPSSLPPPGRWTKWKRKKKGKGKKELKILRKKKKTIFTNEA